MNNRTVHSVPAGEQGSAQAGFTLLEILVVIAILGLLIGLVAPAALRQLGGAKLNIAKQSIERIGATLDLYKLDVGSYPTSEQGLEALVEKPEDATGWNGPYVKSGEYRWILGDIPTHTATPRSEAGTIMTFALLDQAGNQSLRTGFVIPDRSVSA